MEFKDPQLKEYFECVMLQAAGNLPLEQRSVFALMAASDLFRRKDGEQSPGATEAVEHLLSPELRPALRLWYNKSSERMNRAALDFRDYLSQRAGEKFG